MGKHSLNLVTVMELPAKWAKSRRRMCIHNGNECALIRYQQIVIVYDNCCTIEDSRCFGADHRNLSTT
jgi:hypothetical protein